MYYRHQRHRLEPIEAVFYIDLRGVEGPEVRGLVEITASARNVSTPLTRTRPLELLLSPTEMELEWSDLEPKPFDGA